MCEDVNSEVVSVLIVEVGAIGSVDVSEDWDDDDDETTLEYSVENDVDDSVDSSVTNSVVGFCDDDFVKYSPVVDAPVEELSKVLLPLIYVE